MTLLSSFHIGGFIICLTRATLGDACDVEFDLALKLYGWVDAACIFKLKQKILGFLSVFVLSLTSYQFDSLS